VHLDGFIIRIYHDSRSLERKYSQFVIVINFAMETNLKDCNHCRIC